MKAKFDAIMTNKKDSDKQNKKVIDYYPMNTANLHCFKRKNSKKIEKVHKN